jgi:hypothetical protein
MGIRLDAAGKNFTQSAKSAFASVGDAFKGFGGHFNGSTAGAGGFAERVGAFFVNIGAAPFKAVDWAFRNFPVTSILGTGTVAAFGVSSYLRSSAQDRTNAEQLEQAARAMYEVSPEEAALLNARFRQGGQGAGFAEAEKARRAAAVAPPTGGTPSAT